jgi:uncharacterized lipoprotein
MKTSLNRVPGLLVLAALCAGCGLTTDKIGLRYTPRGAREQVAGAERIKVEVKMADSRLNREKLGTKMSGLGGIAATNDVVELIKSAIEGELAQRGFIRGNSVVVYGDLINFSNEFKMGFWAGDSVADLHLEVQVKVQAGNTVFTKRVRTSGLEPNIQVAAGHNAKAALEQALAKGIEELFQDPGFIPSLFKAAGESPP